MFIGFTHDMTIKLLEIIQSKFHLLNDKMHSKKKIWSDIALEMQKNGYLVTYGSKGGDKCHQRWRNLEKTYHGHCRHMKTTGTGKKKPPKYFDEVHEIIGEKHSSQPVNLLDSLRDVSTAGASETCSIETKSHEAVDDTNDSSDTAATTSQNIKENIDNNSSSPNIFENIKKSVRPKTDNISTILKELHEKDTEIENKRFEKFEQLLETQNLLREKTLKQREDFLTVMKNLVTSEARKKSRKRKHSSDSDNS